MPHTYLLEWLSKIHEWKYIVGLKMIVIRDYYQIDAKILTKNFKFYDYFQQFCDRTDL
jgi:hypothetical protein